MEQPANRHEVHCRILFAGILAIDKSWEHLLCNPFWRLYFNDDEGASIRTDDGMFRLPSQQICLVPAWGQFSSQCVRPLKHFYIHFDPIGLSGEWARRHLNRPFVVPSDNHRLALARQLADHLTVTSIWRLRAQSLIADCLATMLEHVPGEALQRFENLLSGDEAISPALRFVEEHLEHPLSLQHLAKLCQLSPDHFGKIFRQRTGQTPTRYIQQRRVSVAAERLIASDDDINHIAADTGFANRYHFTRIFSRHMGAPPAAYRKTGRV
jgi:AraC-like DNA-binding protein